MPSKRASGVRLGNAELWSARTTWHARYLFLREANIILSDIHDPAKDGVLTFRISENGPVKINEIVEILAKVSPALKIEILPNLMILYLPQGRIHAIWRGLQTIPTTSSLTSTQVFAHK